MRITIAGYGQISAAGNSAAEAAATYAAGLANWEADAATGLPVYRARPSAETAIDAFVRHRAADRATLLALHAATEAVAAAGWGGRSDYALLVGCSRGPTGSWEAAYDRHRAGLPAEVRTSPQTTLGSLGFALADYLGLDGLADGLSVTCSSGFHALLHGVALLRAGMAERVLVGGTEAPLTPFTLRQLAALRIYAPLPLAGQAPCRPLEEPPPGLVVGEGAAFFALTTAGVAGPRITGIGFGREGGRSLTGISAGGQALAAALGHADLAGRRPAVIMAHAPGTARGDAAERAAVAAVYGADAPPLTSFKWATGHTFGASGPLGLAAGLGLLVAETESVVVNATGFGGNAVAVGVETGRSEEGPLARLTARRTYAPRS